MRTVAARILVLAALTGAACESSEPRQTQGPSAQPSGATREIESESLLTLGKIQSFVPTTFQQNGRTVMPLTFPDGTTADILYPSDLDIAGMGAQPYNWGRLETCCARDFFVLFGAIPPSQLEGARPLDVYEGADGSQVEYWAVGASGHDPATDRWLIFTFDEWNVLMWDDEGWMTDDQLATWARSLVGRQTDEGFLVLSARSPLELGEAGEHAGPQLIFFSRARRDIVTFAVGDCEVIHDDVVPLGGGARRQARWSGSRCFPDQAMRLHIQSDDEALVRRVVTKVEARNVRPPGAPALQERKSRRARTSAPN